MTSCLIVDDSRVIRKVARQIFAGLGFACEEAEDGGQAMEICKKKLPGFILLDWNMPVINGLDFLRALRTQPAARRTRVIFCTVENDLAHIQEALAAGADEYIMKPFDTDIVKGRLAQLDLIEG